MSMVYLLQLFIPLYEEAYLILQILHFFEHDNSFGFQINFLLEYFLIIDQIFLNVNAATIIKRRFSFFKQILVYLEIDQFLFQQLIFFENLVNLILNFNLSEEGLSFFQFSGIKQCFFWGQDIRSFIFIFELVDDEQQSLIFIIEMLNFNLHLINFGCLHIPFEGLNCALLALDHFIQLLYFILKPDNQSMVISFNMVLDKHLLDFLRFQHSINRNYKQKNNYYQLYQHYRNQQLNYTNQDHTISLYINPIIMSHKLFHSMIESQLLQILNLVNSPYPAIFVRQMQPSLFVVLLIITMLIQNGQGIDLYNTIIIQIKRNMFKDSLGSPRFQTNQSQQNTSILSPRNFLKFITNSIDQVRRATLNTPNKSNYQQFISTFDPYLTLFDEEYKRYRKNKCKKLEGNQKNQELQMELKINKIPSKFFIEPELYKLQICKRNQFKQKQEQLSQYLDQIQVVLFSKSGKYPEKSAIIFNNMAQLQHQANLSLKKVIHFRQQLKDHIFKSSEKQLRINCVQRKIKNIQKILENMKLMKKMRDLKIISERQKQKKDFNNEQILLKVKKSELQVCNKFGCLNKELKNIEKYRNTVKQKLHKQFVEQIQVIFNKLLRYNKDQWKNINIPQSIFVNQQNQNNISQNNITVLDQSYFAFDSKPIQIVKHKEKNQTYQITEQNQQEGEEVLDLRKIYELWNLLKQFDLYDESELNQSMFRVLLKHNTVFNQDMHDYIAYLNGLCKKDKNSLIKNGTTYASLKSKQASLKQQEGQQQSEEQKLSSLDMKLYVKVTKFYFSLLKKILILINSNKQLIFLQNFKQKLCQFLQNRIVYFLDLKKINHDSKIDDFFTYLQITNIWENEQLIQIQQFCDEARRNKIDEYLTSIQKNLLIKQIKQSIESSNYLPVNISSDHYMTFHNLLCPNSGDQANMSMTMNEELQQKEMDSEMTLRLINKNIFYKSKIYKICDSFLELIKHIERYVKLKEHLEGFQQNIQEKICEIVGFYAWYNQKNITNNKTGGKTLKNYCTFYSTLLFLKEILPSLLIVNKKMDKTKIQLNECDTQIAKSITMTPFMMIEEKISQLYESRISTRAQIPTTETQRIIDIVKISMDCLRQYFPIQFQERLNESLIFKFLQTTIKLLYKNYFGYLANMQKRGISQIRWFLPKLKQIVQVTLVSNKKLLDKKGELVCKNGINSFYIFGQQIEQMQKMLRAKSK